MMFYRALLLLYPGSFRAEYGREMAGLFAKRYHRQQSAAARAALWLEAATDAFSNAPAMHWEILKQDLRFAIRTLMRSPALSMTVMLVAALGIGATTAAFTLADHVLIRPLPFPESDRLVKLWQEPPAGCCWETSPGNYRDWKAQATSFDGMAAYNVTSANLVGTGEPLRLDGCLVTGDFFDVLGVPAALGRTIAVDDDREAADRTIVISDRLWRARFGANPSVIGSIVLVNDTSRIVVGVMPPTFEFPLRTSDFWIPFQFRPEAFEDRSDTFLLTVARLKAGVSVEHARSEMRVIAKQLQQVDPRANRYASATAITLRDEISPAITNAADRARRCRCGIASDCMRQSRQPSAHTIALAAA